VLVAVVRKLKTENMLDQNLFVWGAVAAGLVFLLTFLWPQGSRSRSGRRDAGADDENAGYPVPITVEQPVESEPAR
jgi:NADH-quinone oxidoreductase subunit H